MAEMNCPLCSMALRGIPTEKAVPQWVSAINYYDCPECGQYGIEKDGPERRLATLVTEREKSTLAAFVCEQHLEGRKAVIFWNEGREIPDVRSETWIAFGQVLREFPLPPITDKTDRVLRNLARKGRPGNNILIGRFSRGLFVAEDQTTISFLVNALLRHGYVEGSTGLPGNLRLTMEGWQRVEELNRGAFSGTSKQAFVAMCFDRSLEHVYIDGIKPAIEKAGFASMRIDKKPSNNQITDEIIAEIRRSRFMVADCTDHRPAVYYEAGLMHGLGRPVIFTCREDQLKQASFDTNHYPHITWKTPDDLLSQLHARIRATITG